MEKKMSFFGEKMEKLLPFRENKYDEGYNFVLLLSLRMKIKLSLQFSLAISFLYMKGFM